MRIKIKTKDHNFRFWLPNRLLLNPVSAAIFVKAINSKKLVDLQDENFINTPQDERVTYSDTLKFFAAVRQSRKILQGEPMVSVHSADGDVVEIWI